LSSFCRFHPSYPPLSSLLTPQFYQWSLRHPDSSGLPSLLFFSTPLGAGGSSLLFHPFRGWGFFSSFLTSFSPPTIIGKSKGVSWGLSSRSEGRGPTNPLPTPYQHPINTLLTPYQPRTFSGENKSGLGCYDCYSVYRVSCSVFSVLSSMSRVLTFFTSYPLLFTSCLLTSI